MVVRKQDVLQGEALVAAMIEILKEDPEAISWPRTARPEGRGIKPATLDKMKLGNAPLPPSLRTWLLFDEKIGFESFNAESKWWKVAPFWEVLDAPDDLAEHLVIEPFTGPCLFIATSWGGEGGLLLYLGSQDSVGEYPVIDVHLRDLTVDLYSPGLDVYLAGQLKQKLADRFNIPQSGEVAVSHKRWGKRMKEHLRNLGLSRSSMRLLPRR